MTVRNLYAALLALNLVGFSVVASLANSLGVLATPYAITMRAIVLGLSCALLVMAVMRNHTALSKSYFLLFFLLFWGVYLGRLFFDTSFRPSLLARDPEEYWIWAIGTCLTPALALLVKVKSEAFKIGYRLSLLFLIFSSFLIFLSGKTSYLSSSGIVHDIGRFNTESLNPITIGHIGLTLTLLLGWLALLQTKTNFWKKRILTFSGILLGLYLIISSASRGPIVTFFVVTFFYLLSVNLKKTWKPVVFFILLLTIGYALAVHFEKLGRFSAVSRIESAFSENDMAVVGRKTSYAGAWNQFLESPIVGDTLEERGTNFYPHNVILESFMATGVMGGIPFLIMLALGIVSSNKLLKLKSVNGWVGLIFIQYFTAAQFSGAIYNTTIMWTFMSATISCLYATKQDKSFEIIN